MMRSKHTIFLVALTLFLFSTPFLLPLRACPCTDPDLEGCFRCDIYGTTCLDNDVEDPCSVPLDSSGLVYLIALAGAFGVYKLQKKRSLNI